ncbi:hypothetical protein [Streptomyces sp. RKAG293]|uniref:hypothetical protein n=1 Tax=Streptomyces sp. RKAG293 TaxID=2893403 RepID=UPI002033AB75|nr:hypothetical protein [Streptomyces sp. RKAG293]MCM2417671.1 hypothetical protein [Streptomyces sp. RKAG293]
MGSSTYDKLRGTGAKSAPFVDFDPFGKPKPKSVAIASSAEPEQSEQPLAEAVDEPRPQEQTSPVKPRKKSKVGSTESRVPFITEVDEAEKLIARTSAMYPSRHTQLGDMAYLEGRKPWQIIDQALEEYVKRHYPSRKGK